MLQNIKKDETNECKNTNTQKIVFHYIILTDKKIYLTRLSKPENILLIYSKMIGQKNLLGEGLFFDEESSIIWAVDILGQKIISLKHNSWLKTYTFPHKYPSCVIPIENDTTNLLVASYHSIYIWNKITGTTKLIYKFALPDTSRLNDGKCDASGRLWIGTLDMHNRPGRSALYKLEYLKIKSPEVTKVLDVHLSNGLGWNTNQTKFFYIDSLTKSIQIYRFNLFKGTIGTKLDTIDLLPPVFPVGIPDGLTIDNSDNLWVAIWGGSKIVRIDSEDHTILEEISVKSEFVTTSVIHPSGYLYVTAAKDKIHKIALNHPYIENQFCYKFRSNNI